MTRAGIILVLAAVFVLAGCSNAPKCDELAFYEYAQGGRRLEPPDDLKPLDRNKEMVIPEASPRPPRDLRAGCLDRPPTLPIGRDREINSD